MAFPDNFRTLEGFKTSNGVTNGFLARSGCPEQLITEERRQELLSMGFKVILDLRRTEEVERKKSGYEGFEYKNIPLINTPYKVKSELPLRGAEYYNRCVSEKDNVSQIFKFLANSKNGIIYHCAGGKSRTGVITALLFSLLGVKDDEIINDYCRSYLELYDETVYKEKSPLGEIDIKNFLKLIRQNFENVENFLKFTGVTDEEIRRLKQKVVTKAPP